MDHVSEIARPAMADWDGAMFSGLEMKTVADMYRIPIALFEKDKELLVWNRGAIEGGTPSVTAMKQGDSELPQREAER